MNTTEINLLITFAIGLCLGAYNKHQQYKLVKQELEYLKQELEDTKHDAEFYKKLADLLGETENE